MSSVLITGAAIRVGSHMARYFAQKGYDVFLHAHSSCAELKALKLSLLEEFQGLRVETFLADLTDTLSAKKLMQDVLSRVQILDVLVNNASLFKYDQLSSFKEEDLQKMMGVHLVAPLLLSQGFVQRFMERAPQGSVGHIINIVDAKIEKPSSHYLSYTLSKSALWNATQMLALQCAPRIRVNAIAPGPLLPTKGQESYFESLCNVLPLQKAALLDDVSCALDFILRSSSTTGQMIFIDGGQHLSSLSLGASSCLPHS